MLRVVEVGLNGVDGMVVWLGDESYLMLIVYTARGKLTHALV